MPLNHMVGALIVLIVALSWVGAERAEEQVQHEFFCEMIEDFERSGGEYGYPDDGRECDE